MGVCPGPTRQPPARAAGDAGGDAEQSGRRAAEWGSGVGGGLDIELDVFHGGRHYVYLSQVRMDGGAWVRDLVNGVDGQVATASTAATNLLDLALDPQQGEPLDASLRANWPPPTAPGDTAPVSDSEKPFPGVTCKRYKKVGPLKSTWTTVASASAINGPEIKTEYLRGARSVLSTGFSFDAGSTFSINGARERVSTTKADFIDRRAGRGETISHAFQVEWEHQVLRRACLLDYDNHYTFQYTTTPVGTPGGSKDIVDTTRTPVSCDDKRRRARAHVDSISTEHQKAATYESAFRLVPLAGGVLSGNALSGYSDQVKVEFSFSRPERGWWCGHDGKPAYEGQILQGYEK